MRSLRDLIQRFRADQRGGFAIMSAILMVVVIGAAALGIDVGAIFAERRRTQSTTDLAAIIAANNLATATAAATATATRNNYPASSVIGVELGVYQANAALSPQARFVASATPANAARVTLQSQAPLTFGKFLTGLDSFTIRTSATASNTAMASFSIGSRLASLNGGLLNAMLGSMLGTSLSLSAMDYNALLNTRVDLFDTMSALATRLNLTAGTYNDLLTASAKPGDVIAALQSVTGASTAASALSSVVQALAGSATRISLGQIASLSSYGDLNVGQKPKVGVSVSALDLLNAVAEVANGNNQIATSLSLGLPGIASVSVQVAVGERPQGSGWIAVGKEGVSVHTAQTRALLSIQLVGSGSVSVVNLPVYVEVASGTATLKKISCGQPDISTSSVTLAVTPGIVDAWIGNVTQAQMTNFTSKPSPGAATLVNLGLVTVTGRAHAGMGNTTPTDVIFSYADIQAQTKKTVTTSNFTSSLTSSLLGDLQLAVNVGPLGLPIPGLAGLVSGIIGGATGSIDQVITSVLSTLGVGVGQADVWVSGVRCDGAVLVN